MAGMTPTNRRGRRAARDTALVEPAIDVAIDAGTERAAIERAPADAVDAVTVATAPCPDLPAEDASVLPEPTLVALPDAPQPIVTASPVLAVEPGAMDVVAADAAAERVAAGIEPAPDRDGPHAATAGQPTLTIEPPSGRVVAVVAGSPGLSREGARQARNQRSTESTPSIDALLRDLRAIMQRDPEAYWRVREELACDQPVERGDVATAASTAPTLTVIEVVGPPQGRRRAGMTFGPQPQRFLSAELDDDEIAALRADPLLAVGVSEVEEDDVAAFLGVSG